MNAFAPTAIGLLKPVQALLNNQKISEILINRPQEVWFEIDGIMTKQTCVELTEFHLKNLFQVIANEAELALNKKTPLLSTSLSNGFRVQLCIPPTAKHYCLSIRKPSLKITELTHYRDSNFFSKTNLNQNSDQQLIDLYQQQDWHQFLITAIQQKKNLVISGGTSSGKTTFLNNYLQAINASERLIILEDTREVSAKHANKVQLLTSAQGLGKISMQDLVQCSLRLRPDRIIMGEIRGKEIMDFISACSTGHPGSLTTLHADSCQQAFSRMTQLYKLNNIPAMTDSEILAQLKASIDIIVQLKKTPAGRRATEIYFKECS